MKCELTFILKYANHRKYNVFVREFGTYLIWHLPHFIHSQHWELLDEELHTSNFSVR